MKNNNIYIYMKLTNDSQILLDFIKNCKINNERFSNKSQNFFKNILRTIYKKYNSYKPIVYHEDADEMMPSRIEKYIENQIQSYYSIVDLKNRKYKIIFYFENKQTEKKLNIYFFKVYLLLHVLNSYSTNTEISHNVVLQIFMSEHKKYLPKNKIPLDEEHVNSAYTRTCTQSTEICVFRKEEWFKVLIHELFHNMGLDFACMNHTDADKLIFNLIKLKKNDIRLYESYTECWANILNTVFLAFFDTKIKKNYDIMLAKIEKMTQNEICFALFQLKKVLNHYNLKYNEIYKANNNYKENTHVISYYMIKLIFLYNKNKFIEWNHSHNSYIQFTQTQENIIELCKFIYSLYDQSCFIEDIEEFSKKTSNNQLINKSMRMTVYEMEN